MRSLTSATVLPDGAAGDFPGNCGHCVSQDDVRDEIRSVAHAGRYKQTASVQIARADAGPRPVYRVRLPDKFAECRPMKQVDDADACWADMLEGEHRPERRFYERPRSRVSFCALIARIPHIVRLDERLLLLALRCCFAFWRIAWISACAAGERRASARVVIPIGPAVLGKSIGNMAIRRCSWSSRATCRGHTET